MTDSASFRANRRKHGVLRLSGIGDIKLRGRPRNEGDVTTCKIHRKNGYWYASMTISCIPIRKNGPGAAGHDWGVSAFSTYAYEDGSYEEIPNPRFSAKHEASVERAQRHLDAVTVKDAIGRPTNGKEMRRIAAKRSLGRAKMHEANARKDFLHQISAQEIAENCLHVTEQLDIRNLVRSAKGTLEKPGKNVSQKTGLNREILATSPSTFNSMRRYKAEEARSWYIETPTRKLKRLSGVRIAGSFLTKRRRSPSGFIIASLAD